MPNINRQPAGQPTGGQFAEGARAGANVALDASEPSREEILGDALISTAKVQHAQATAQEIADSGNDDKWTRYEPFEEHFPNLDVEAFTADIYEPAVNAMADGRKDDAFDLLDIAERLDSRERRLRE